jgi:epoxyqueuosine reductase
MRLTEKSELIKAEALRLGFEACGISKAKKLDREAQFLEKWLSNGLHAAMHYMQNHFEKRVDPTKLVHGAKSVISVAMNYFPENEQKEKAAPVLSKYAYGTDYHFVLKDRLKTLFKFIDDRIEKITGRVFVDSAPVLDRAWAARSGIGWIGKNTNLILPESGSFVFLGELIIDLELEYDSPMADRCGSCTKCISACPTNALIMPYKLDSSRCISFLTIENKDEIPDKFKGRFENRVFGCDICQDVCPWNNRAKATNVHEFKPQKKLLELSREEWHNLDEENYRKLFKKSAVKRAKYSGLKRNIDFLKPSK